MEITPESMEAMILRNVGDLNADPYLKKLFSELKALKAEIDSSSSKPVKVSQNTVPVKPQVKTVKKRRVRTPVSPSKVERRKSARINSDGRPVKYNFEYDEDIENNRLYANGQLRLDYVTNRPKSKNIKRRSYTPRVILSPDEITEEMFKNVSLNSNDKVYDKENGTSCHQCRQKTRDTKTICRNLDCVGVQGQFCGPCALNRYGVNIVDALKDPYWSCFVCQQICNCSFCRAKEGKRPTGILTHIAKKEGHNSVKEFLDVLGKTHVIEDEEKWRRSDPESLLGFQQNEVHTVAGIEHLSTDGNSHAIIQEVMEDFNSYFCGF